MQGEEEKMARWHGLVCDSPWFPSAGVTLTLPHFHVASVSVCERTE